ncbi:uncharacterized protein LOC141599003 [Silene latifolia]|uniref:uncharacterized protein LOC141599003 n=1 Tax=Silene latifolia TaxID=37657 RepID=UPI003D78744F
MEDITFADEISAINAATNNNPNHGWQKVTYAKKRKNQNASNAKSAVTAAATGGSTAERENGNVFRAIELQSEDRHRRIVEAKKNSTAEIDDDEDYTGKKNGRSKKRDSDESDSDDAEERENGNVGGVNEVKKEKKKKPKAEKKPKVSVTEAGSKIDSESLSAFLVDISATYEAQEDVQLMRFADFFGRAFSGVGSAQFPWVKTFKESPVPKIVDIPLSHIPEAVYKTSVDWINQRSTTALSSFALLLLDSILTDLANHITSVKSSKKASQQLSSKSQVAIFAVLAMVLRRKPDVLLSVLPTLRENSKYQGQDKLPVIIWMICQASLGDLAVGLYAWAHNLLPLLNSKSTNNPLNRDLILQLVERILAVPKARTILVNNAVKRGERVIPPAELETLMRATFPVSSARVKATERFESAYPILKDVALTGAAGSKAMKQVAVQIFGFSITAAGEANPEVAKEATNLVLWCLDQNSDIYKHWDKIYLDNLEASVAILKKLSVHIREHQVNQSSVEVVKQTMKSFQQKNEEALAEGKIAHQTLKDADKYAKSILGRLSRGHGCLKAFFLIGIAVAAGAAVMSSNPETFDFVDWNKVTVMLNSFQSS